MQVRIFDDRIEIWNPGSLPKGLTIDDLKSEHRSQPRNTLIADCFYHIKYIEQWGTGTNRMIRLCKQAGTPEPSFTQTHDSFIVTFKRLLTSTKKTPVDRDLNQTQKSILEYIRKHNGASTSELVIHLKMSDRAVQKNLHSLKRILRWTGKSENDPTGKYELR